MGVEEGSKYYDRHISKDLGRNKHWRQLYNQAASYLPPPISGVAIADLGCGQGYFAKILYEKGYRGYWGVDFSPVRIKLARQAVPKFTRKFKVGALKDPAILKRFVNYDVFVCLQTLEHIKGDLKLLEAIPKDKMVILSVPSTGGTGHVRNFVGPAAVEKRYGGLIDFKVLASIYRGRGKAYFYLGWGTRR